MSQKKPSKLHIYTARSEQTINTTSTLTFGFENPKIYPGVIRNSFNMNYKQLTKSFNDLWNLSLNRHGSNKSDPQFMTKVCKTDWILQIENVLHHA